MTASNPTGQARSTGSAYITLLLDTLGNQEPMPIHETTPARIARAIAGLDAVTLSRPEQPGKWSIVGVIQHLADSELVYGYRIRMIASHPTPDIQAFDQDLWARELDYEHRDAAQALEDFRAQREANVRCCGPSTPRNWGAGVTTASAGGRVSPT